ncbi:MAG: hypothetical protein R3C27_02000 [Hyphomonadaceae bacterium]
MRNLALICAAAAVLTAAPVAAQDINDIIDFEQNISAQAERFADHDDRHTQAVQTRDAQNDAGADSDEAASASDRDADSHDEMEGRKWGDSDTQVRASPSH